ncbi:hypothetical protein FQN53_003444 [Emmonsiellopsis sp. PD_33]|nr:hypothetical protein FQN53_003444 [Emmonsiellopsis sp. PD_33]
MATRISPASNLLRKSRLFALPPALTPPPQSLSSGAISESETATLPYPTRAAIVTPASSLARGDWGLKRPLPAKSTTQSSTTPVVRINELDTFEHITDFNSAGDHVKTLEKWQELSLPVSIPHKTGISVQHGGGRHESVFETNLDNTHDSPRAAEITDAQRFRFKGPWLAGQTDIEFDRWLVSVRRQKPQLMEKLRQLIANNRLADARRSAREEGKDLANLQEPTPLSDKEFGDAIKALRADPKSLGRAIYEILDLAPPPPTPNDRIHTGGWGFAPSNSSSTEYGRYGPPKTHPSAGLSYLRTGAQIDNHPIAGPQVHSKPVQARILKPKRRVGGQTTEATVGVGGIVTDDPRAHGFRERNAPSGISDFDPDVPGGAKYWVRPVRAAVDSEGKIDLKIDRASDASAALHGVLPEPKEVPAVLQSRDRSFGGLTSPRSPQTSGGDAKDLLATLRL